MTCVRRLLAWLSAHLLDIFPVAPDPADVHPDDRARRW